MRSTNDVALELVAQNVGVASLAAPGHGLADERERLMPVEAAELDDFAVEFEAVVSEFGVTEADAAVIPINELGASQKPDMNGIEIVVVEIPELDSAQAVEV